MQRLFLWILSFGFIIYVTSCSSNGEPEPVDCSISDLDIDATSENPASCITNDGSITASATGGDEPYKYALNTGSFNTTSSFTNLGSGDYLVRVKDKNGCEVSMEVSLQIPGTGQLSAAVITTEDTDCVDGNGSIAVTASGGTEPYAYRIGSGTFSAISTFSGLQPGNYSIAVRDAVDCIFTKGVGVGKGDTETSLSADIEPIIETKCAITNCHNGSESPDLRIVSNIISHASQIKSLTQSGQMPESNSTAGPLSSAQKALIMCWVDEGAKDN